MSFTTTITSSNSVNFPAVLRSQEADPKGQMIAAMNRTASNTSALFEEALGAYESQKEEMASAIEKLGQTNTRLQDINERLQAQLHEQALMYQQQLNKLNQRIQTISKEAMLSRQEISKVCGEIIHRQEQQAICQLAYQTHHINAIENGYYYPMNPQYGFHQGIGNPSCNGYAYEAYLTQKLDESNRARVTQIANPLLVFASETEADVKGIQRRSEDLDKDIQDLKALVDQMRTDAEDV